MKRSECSASTPPIQSGSSLDDLERLDRMKFKRIEYVKQLSDRYRYDPATDIIGSGAFSTVYRAVARNTNATVALKVLLKKRLEGDKASKDVAREVSVLESVCHGSICGFVEAVQTEQEVAIALTLVDGCVDLGTLMKKSQRLSEAHAALITIQLLHAVQYLHSRNLIHRDLKPDNILLSQWIPVTPSEDTDKEGKESMQFPDPTSATFTAGKKASDTDKSHTAIADDDAEVQPFSFDDVPLEWSHVTLVDFGFARPVCSAQNDGHGDLNSSVTAASEEGAKSHGTVHRDVGPPTPLGSSKTMVPATLDVASVTDGDVAVTDCPVGTVPLSVPVSPAVTYKERGSHPTRRSTSPEPLGLPPSEFDVSAPGDALHSINQRGSKISPASTPPQRSMERAGSELPFGSESTARADLLEPSPDLAPQQPFDSPVYLSPCGTDRYLPLEVIKWLVQRGGACFETTPDLARKIDSFALGVTVYVMLSGCFPYNAKSRPTLALQLNTPPRTTSSNWLGISAAAKSFVTGLLEPDATKRLSIAQALEHPWLIGAMEQLPSHVRARLAALNRIGSMKSPVQPHQQAFSRQSSRTSTSHNSCPVLNSASDPSSPQPGTPSSGVLVPLPDAVGTGGISPKKESDLSHGWDVVQVEPVAESGSARRLGTKSE